MLCALFLLTLGCIIKKQTNMRILRWLARKSLQALGWKLMGDLPPHIQQAVLIVAPHTSNWDGVYGLLFCFAKRLPTRFVIKKEAMVFPLGWLLKRLGAVPIDRKRKRNNTQQGGMAQAIAALFQQQKPLLLIIAPEGTRSRVARWRLGFYHIAQQAQVPIVLGYIDYAKKHIGLGPVFYPTGVLDEDLRQLQAFYKDIQGKYPAQSMPL